MVLEKNDVVAVICLYGLFGTEDNSYDRNEVEMKGYQEYLSGVVNQIKKNDIKIVVLSGGKTRKDHPKMSEAESVYSEFRKLLRAQGLYPNVYWEEESTSTPENISFSWNLVNKHSQYHNFIFFCDKVRVIKVLLILLKDLWKEILKGKMCFKIIGVNRADIHPNSKWWKQLSAGIRYLIFHK